MFVVFSCKQRCTCLSCHQKRTLLTAIHVAEEACFAFAHQQVVLTIPKRPRLHIRFRNEGEVRHWLRHRDNLGFVSIQDAMVNTNIGDRTSKSLAGARRTDPQRLLVDECLIQHVQPNDLGLFLPLT